MSDFEVIENNDKAKEEYGLAYGDFEYKITLKDIEALKKGKCLATGTYNGEYTIFISLEGDTNE